MTTEAEKDFVLLQCGEFLLNELMFGGRSKAMQLIITNLKDACFKALGNPSITEAEAICERALALVGEDGDARESHKERQI